MTGAPGGTDGGDEHAEPEIVNTTISPDPASAEYEFLEVIACLEDAEVEDLPPLYDQIDDFVSRLYDRPPAPEAEMELAFSYCGYRVRLTRDGGLTLVDVKTTLDGE